MDGTIDSDILCFKYNAVFISEGNDKSSVIGGQH